jgi:CheY-like chemotaxis protein
MEEKHIVVVDDNPVDLEVIKQVLTDYGMRVSVFESCIEANDAIFSGQVDLIILDIEMPFINGGTKARILKENRKIAAIPIMMISSKSDEEMQKIVVDCNADGYIKKPISRFELIRTLHILLKGSKG